MKIAFINGEYIASSEAKISIFDRGFLFGDGVYEVLPVYKGKLCFLKHHIDRLHSSLTQVKIPAPNMDWINIFEQLIHLNGGGDQQVYLQVTRGTQATRQHNIPDGIDPTVIAFSMHTAYPTQDKKTQGLRASLVDDYRWEKCHVKSTSLLANILLNDQAVSNGADTAILLRNGALTEGSSSNVFIIDKDDQVRTSPLDQFCLPGITRKIAIELLTKLNIHVNEGLITKEDLLSAKEVWVTSTTKEIYPVRFIDDHLIGSGKNGLIWSKLNTLYQELVNA